MNKWVLPLRGRDVRAHAYKTINANVAPTHGNPFLSSSISHQFVPSFVVPHFFHRLAGKVKRLSRGCYGVGAGLEVRLRMCIRGSYCDRFRIRILALWYADKRKTTSPAFGLDSKGVVTWICNCMFSSFSHHRRSQLTIWPSTMNVHAYAITLTSILVLILVLCTCRFRMKASAQMPTKFIS